MTASVTAPGRPVSAAGETLNGRRYGLAVTLVSLLLIGVLALFALDRMLNPAQFHIEKVRVKGAVEHVSPAAVERRILDSLQGNYFSLDLEELEAAVEALPWVHHAALHRRWPGTLVVEVDEVQPVAKWGDAAWLNVTGDVVRLPEGTELKGLPSLSGPAGKEAELWARFRDWQGLMSANGAHLRGLELDRRGTWTLRFDLSPLAAAKVAPAAVPPPGEQPPAGAEGKQAAVQAAEREVAIVVRGEEADRLLSRFALALKFTFLDQLERMDYVDLRYPNGFAIRWRKPVGDAQEKTR